MPHYSIYHLTITLLTTQCKFQNALTGSFVVSYIHASRICKFYEGRQLSVPEKTS